MTTTMFEQDCITKEAGLKCGGCKFISGTTRQAITTKTLYSISCTTCKDNFHYQSFDTTGYFDGTATPRFAVGIVDISLSCSETQVTAPPSDITTAIVIVAIMGAVAFICIVGMLVFCIKRKPPSPAYEPKWPTQKEENTADNSAIVQLKSNDDPRRNDQPTPIRAGEPIHFNDAPSNPQTGNEMGSPDPMISKAKTLRKRNLKPAGEKNAEGDHQI